MTCDYSRPEPRHVKWLKKEQGRFLKKARLRAGLSVRDVARRTGVDIRWVESGEVNLYLKNLRFLIQLYRVPPDYFIVWEQYASLKIRQLAPPRLLH